MHKWLNSWLLIGFILSLPRIGQAQNKATWLPQGHLFETILLDPLEAQIGGSLVKNSNGELNHHGLYAPFSIGGKKELVRWSNTPLGKGESELGLDVVALTQFELYEDANDTKRRMMNVDYRIGLHYQFRNETSSTRVRLYHLSSHLGDDYVISRGITSFFENKVNYEQIDVTHSVQYRSIRYYGGLGLSLRPFTERKPLMLQGGIFYRGEGYFRKMIAGVDMKLWQQNQFIPNLKAAWGFEWGESSQSLSLLIEGYTGKLPYSPLEQASISWLGIGIYFKPF